MAEYKERPIVAAIEIGSTYSGYEYSFNLDLNDSPLMIHRNVWNTWNVDSGSLINYKTPTTLLLNPDQSFMSFGYDAQNDYSDLYEVAEASDYFYFHRFNETLNKNTEVRTTTMLKAANPDKILPAQNVYAHAIRYFKGHLLQSVKNEYKHIREDDILFVLVVPSNWDGGSVQFMKEAANIADIPTDQLLIVSECEAALAYYHFFCIESEAADKQEVHKPGRRTLIVDVGGGTLKTSVVKKSHMDGYIKEFDTTIDKIGNGNLVDEAFICFLDEIIGQDRLEELKEERLGDYFNLLREFEIKKRCIKTKKRSKMSIPIPMVLLDIMKKEKDKLSKKTTESKYSHCVQFEEGKIQIDVETFSEFFQQTIDGVINIIDGILCDEKFSNIEDILLHGGFANCELLQNTVINKYKNSPIHIPVLADLVVIDGAVLRGHNQTEIYLTAEKSVETSPAAVGGKSSSIIAESFTSDQLTLMKEKKSLKDNSPLFKAIMERNKDETERLIKANMDPLLPDEIGITPFGYALDTGQQDVVKLISTEICKQFKSFIQSNYGNLLYKTWMGYILGKECADPENTLQSIRIVGIYTKQSPCTFCKYFRNIRIRWRQKEEVSDEGSMTSQYENINVNFENKIPPELAKTLFNEHSNLTILHFSSVKSTNFPTESSRIVKKPCLALYCHIKGIIPLGEKQFNETVGAFEPYEIDVREGYCTLNHGDLRPGTAIYCPDFNKDGTTGGFVESCNGGIAIITAAHIVTNCALRRLSENDQQQFLKSKNILVCKKTNNEPIGRVAQWCFDSGNYNQISIDAAIIEVDRRIISTDSMFPDTNQIQWNQAGYNSSNLPRMCTRQIMSLNEICSNRRSDVIKYGMSTQVTIGNLIYNEAYIKPHYEHVHVDDVDSSGNVYDSEDFVMCCQMGIQGRGEHFSEPGDSGAFCCMIDKDDETVVRSFGMLIAGSTSGVSFVTPLENVFQALKLNFSKGIKSFPQNAQTQGAPTNLPMPNQTENMILQQLQLLNVSIQHVSSKQQEMISEQQQIWKTLEIQNQKIDNIAKNKKS